MQTRGKEKSTAMLFSVMTIVLYFCCDAKTYSVYVDAPLQNAMMYPFFHANIMHLFCNLWVFLSIVFYRHTSFAMLITTFLAAVAAGLLPIYYNVGKPVAGMSGWIYCLLGRYGVTFNANRDMRYNAAMTATIATGILLPNISWQIHATCYLAGLVIGFFTEPLKNKKYDRYYKKN